jgi:signal peptidase I
MESNEMDENMNGPLQPAQGEYMAASPDPASLDKKGFDIVKELYEWASALVFSIVFLVILFTFFFRIIGVDGASMEPTLYNNDKVIVTNLLYTPRQGDIVVFRKESFLDEPIVKRVIATEGQTVDINFITHEVRVDGVLLDEPYVKAPTTRPGDVEFPVVVPEGYVFVLGDNRNNSADSRFSSVGMIDVRYILGHVIYRLYPFDKIGKVK